MATFSTPGSLAVPALPGATNTFSTFGDCASFHASACSRPPLPSTSIFIDRLSHQAVCRVRRPSLVRALPLMTEVTHTRKYHGHAGFVGCGNDFFIAHGTAGLDYSGDAGFCSS